MANSPQMAAKEPGGSAGFQAAPPISKAARQPAAADRDAPFLEMAGQPARAADLQRVAGSLAVTRAISSGAPARRIGVADDMHERAAARIADEAVNAREGVGRFCKSRFGLDVDTVGLHHGDGAAGAARAMRAKAFTAGKDTIFGAGRYNPDSREGLRLLAHELTHVVQQTSPGANATAAGSVAGPIVQREPDDKAPVPFGPAYPQKRARLSSFEDYGAGDRQVQLRAEHCLPGEGRRNLAAVSQFGGSVPRLQSAGGCGCDQGRSPRRGRPPLHVSVLWSVHANGRWDQAFPQVEGTDAAVPRQLDRGFLGKRQRPCGGAGQRADASGRGEGGAGRHGSQGESGGAVTNESNAVQEWKSTISRSAVKAAVFERAIRVLSRKDVNNPAPAESSDERASPASPADTAGRFSEALP